MTENIMTNRGVDGGGGDILQCLRKFLSQAQAVYVSQAKVVYLSQAKVVYLKDFNEI